jgi:hypothetical protein
MRFGQKLANVVCIVCAHLFKVEGHHTRNVLAETNVKNYVFGLIATHACINKTKTRMNALRISYEIDLRRQYQESRAQGLLNIFSPAKLVTSPFVWHLDKRMDKNIDSVMLRYERVRLRIGIYIRENVITADDFLKRRRTVSGRACVRLKWR